jgi:hypothetical protein
MKVSKVAKTIVAAAGAAVTALTAAMSDGTVSTSEAIMVALAVLTAFGIYVVPNSTDEEK